MRERLTEPELTEIYGATIDALYGYASRRCGGDRDLAEDVTQETWLRAVREWRRTGAPRTPLAWLQTVARNLILNHLRRKPNVSLDDVAQSDVLAAVDRNAVTDSAEIATIVGRALARIPVAEAGLLESFHYERHKTADLAQAYGISERAVEGRLRRARERLRREIELTLKSAGDLV
jgi:RNA polymerase sigma-70 factor (ECF subfamily)